MSGHGWCWRAGVVAASLAVVPVAHSSPAPTNGMTMDAKVLDGAASLRVRVRYWLACPPGYEREGPQRWPLLLFLHGAGERGDDLERVKQHGPPKLIAAGRVLPFIVVAPQCPADDWWDSARQILALRTLLDDVIAAHRVDRDRVYVTGLSMGGFGTWRLAAEFPELFAAIAPICGGGPWYRAGALRQVPAWVFHGADDPVVPLRESEVMVEALRRVGAQPRFTVYPNTGHDAWTAAYEGPELYEWLLQHRRGAAPAAGGAQ
ncbi:MAG: prolyl oligopeptidase family serine peptidase [Kiritimatiellae bacterium]|nr:prolyl oligopeptidase family serine peptidase [Kiritimatiellia bacterium]